MFISLQWLFGSCSHGIIHRGSSWASYLKSMLLTLCPSVLSWSHLISFGRRVLGHHKTQWDYFWILAFNILMKFLVFKSIYEYFMNIQSLLPLQSIPSSPSLFPRASLLWSASSGHFLTFLLGYLSYWCIVSLICSGYRAFISHLHYQFPEAYLTAWSFSLLSVQTYPSFPLWLILFWVLCLKTFLYSKFMKMLSWIFAQSFGSPVLVTIYVKVFFTIRWD